METPLFPENPHIHYVRETLNAAGHDVHEQPRLSFFLRSGHCERVLMWAERLMTHCPVDDPEAVRLAAAFHDIGYVGGGEGHAGRSAQMLREYGEVRGIDAALLGRAVFLVEHHSDKEEWLGKPGTPADLMLLMEADLLDGEGAMGLVMDAMSAALDGADSFAAAYAHMRRFEERRLTRNPMITPPARLMWAEKQALIRTFLHQLEGDLGVHADAP